MKSRDHRLLLNLSHGVIAMISVAVLSLGQTMVLAQQPEAQSTESPAPKIPNDQLDSLVAPIALYPDPLLAQTLAASTYPLEVIQLQQWLAKNKSLKGKALADAAEKQNWDPSIQAMALLPDVVKQLADNVSWTMDLGNAFLAQQADVMDAVQRMRAKAQGAGNLKASSQQKVETKTVESKTVIVIEQADPQVVYVPTYNPTVVYGAAVYPYPPIVYPPYYGALAFGAGIAIGAAWGNGGWGYGCGWGHGDVDINVNNKYVNHYNKNNNINNGTRPGAGGSGTKWQHSAQHRGGAPYGDRGTANKYGGNARQQPAGGAGNRPGGGGSGTANRPGGGAGGGAANRPGGGGSGTANRPGGGGGAGNRPGGGGGGASASTRPASRPSGGGGGGNNIGNRSASSGSGFGSSNNAFGGGGGGSSARASSNRGGQSMGGGGFSGGGSRGGGGGYSRGGGGGGGSRGGGGGGGRGGGRRR